MATARIPTVRGRGREPPATGAAAAMLASVAPNGVGTTVVSHRSGSAGTGGGSDECTGVDDEPGRLQLPEGAVREVREDVRIGTPGRRDDGRLLGRRDRQ